MRMLCDLTGGETHGCIYWGTARRENTHWQKAYGPKAGTLVQHYVGRCLPERGPLWSASTALLPPYHPCSTNALPPGAIWIPRVRVPRGMAARR